MTGYIKTERAGWAAMWSNVIDKNSVSLSFDNMSDRPIKGTEDWTKCEIVLDVPKEGHAINFGVLLSGTGKVWFDDISFEDIDRKNPPIPTEYLFRPTNMDFEE